MENNQENIPPVIQTEPVKQNWFSKYKLLWSVIIAILLAVILGLVLWRNITKETEVSANVIFKGTVISNNTGCSYDDTCVLIIQTIDGRKVNAIYGGGLTPNGACYLSAGFEIQSGDQVEVSGKFTDQNTFSLCEKSSYINKLQHSPSTLESADVKVSNLKPDSFEWCIANGGDNRTPNYNAPKVCILNNKVYKESCVSNDKYFVISKHIRDSVGSDILVKYKTSLNKNISCEYLKENTDFEVKPK